MESDFIEWMYLKLLVGNFEGMYQYYFSTMAFMAPWFRQGAVGVLYSLGLAWAALCFLKAPVDRLQAGLGVLGMVLIAGFLVSPTTNTKYLGSAAGTELSVGGYYSFVLAGAMTKVFNDVVSASWKSSIVEAGGGGGPNKESLAMAFNDKAEEFSEKFLKGEGKEAVKDYYQRCGSEALKAATTTKDKSILRSVGIGANTLGMDSYDASTMGQYVEKAANRNTDWMTALAMGADGGIGMYQASLYEAEQMDARRSEAEVFLQNLPISDSAIDGTKGYRIPTSTYYKEKLSNNDGSNGSTGNAFKTISGSSTRLQEMKPNGATTTTPNGPDDFIFYPKNCYDLYLVASETMSSLRKGAKDVPGYENMDLAGSYVAMSAANKVRRGINDMATQQLKELGIDEQIDESALEAFGDTIYQGATELSNSFDKWMLEYKIPTVISSMAMIVALLLLTFPIFALVSVIFGHKVLVSFFKLMAFPFLVVFTNNLLLSLAANLITFNKAYSILPETFNPGGVDVPASMSVMSAETIIYAVICICEVAIVKFILWDDVRAVTSFNPGAASTAAVARGAGMVGAALSLVGGVFGRGAKMAAASKSSKATQALNQTIAGISKQVTHIANSGNRTQNRSPGLSGGGSGPGRGDGGTTPGGGGGITPGGGGTSLNPPPKPTT